MKKIKSKSKLNKIAVVFSILFLLLSISCGNNNLDNPNLDSPDNPDNPNPDNPDPDDPNPDNPDPDNPGTKVNTSLEEIVNNGFISNDVLTTTDMLVADTLGRVGGSDGATINAIYVTESGSGDFSGSSWTNADRGENLRTVINGINDASANKIYVVLIGAGTYQATTGGDRTISFSMKNHTAIIGGFDVSNSGSEQIGSWSRSVGSVTAFDGGGASPTSGPGQSQRIFEHRNNSIDRTAVLYGAEIRNNSQNGIVEGGGMYNNNVSPTIIKVTFLNNLSGGSQGGGMFNESSSPLIKDSSFISNHDPNGGGGMVNVRSSPLLINVVFLFNSAGSRLVAGGPPSSGAGQGGGMFNYDASPTLINTIIVNNSDSGSRGGGIFIASSGTVRGSMLVNSVVWANTGRNNASQQIYIGDVRGPEVNNLILSGTVLQGDTNNISMERSDDPDHITNFNVVVTDPNLGSLEVFSNGSRYMTISTGSSAANIGLHVKLDGVFENNANATGATLYYSEDNTTWYTTITRSGLADSATPPSTAVYLTKYDATGQERTDRPDAGVYEAR